MTEKRKIRNKSFLSRFLAFVMGLALAVTPMIPVYATSDVNSEVISDTVTEENEQEETQETVEAPDTDPSGVTAAVIADAKPNFDVHSHAVYMVNTDAAADIKVYAQNENDLWSPASLTKIMTAMIVLENMESLDDVVTAPSYVFDELFGLGASNADIRHGEQITVRDLLYALMLRSACEASGILAHYICPDDPAAFVAMMNEKAKELGCTNTNFVNSHGLDAEGQYTSAYDMYLITAYAMQNETFAEIACATSYVMQPTNIHTEERKISHTNFMLSSYYGGSYYYEYAKGIKTGTTGEAGRNLITVAEKDGYNYMLVTMGAPYRDENGAQISENYSYIDHKNLYEWAFDVFRFTTVIQEYQSLDEVAVRFGENSNHVTVTAQKKVIMLLPETLDTSTILVEPTLPEYVDAPVVKGDVIGKAELKLAGEVIASVALIAENDVARSGLAYSLHLVKRFFANPWVIIACIVLLLLIGLLIFFVVGERKKRRKDKLRKKFGKRPSMPSSRPKNPNSWR